MEQDLAQMVFNYIYKRFQWRIQDFPEKGALTSKGGAYLLFGQLFPKTAWKWRNFGPEGGGHASLAPPLRSATGF